MSNEGRSGKLPMEATGGAAPFKGVNMVFLVVFCAVLMGVAAGMKVRE